MKKKTRTIIIETPIWVGDKVRERTTKNEGIVTDVCVTLSGNIFVKSMGVNAILQNEVEFFELIEQDAFKL